jgi:hypothetical protein
LLFSPYPKNVSSQSSDYKRNLNVAPLIVQRPIPKEVSCDPNPIDDQQARIHESDVGIMSKRNRNAAPAIYLYSHGRSLFHPGRADLVNRAAEEPDHRQEVVFGVGGLAVPMSLAIIAASLAVGETRVSRLFATQLAAKCTVKPLPWASLGVIGVHRQACRIQFQIE